MKAAIYARVSTLHQEPENQLQELRRYVGARGWTAVEYVDRGVSGAKDRRPALDQLLTDAKRRRFDVLVCWRLDRLGRSLKHLITLLDDLQALGIAFVSLAEGIDATTPAGKLQMHILGAIAEFERARIVERVRAGLARRAAPGKPLGRPRQTISEDDLARTGGLSTRKAAALLGVSHAAVHRARAVSKPQRAASRMRLKRALSRARSAVTVATVTVTAGDQVCARRRMRVEPSGHDTLVPEERRLLANGFLRRLYDNRAASGNVGRTTSCTSSSRRIRQAVDCRPVQTLPDC